MIFVDTSALFALANRGDLYHREARKMLEHLESSGETLLTHNYVVVESAALIHGRLGLATTCRFLREASELTMRWVSPEEHDEAVREFETRASAKVSFVDVVSFVVMRAEGLTSYFGYDEHFTAAGFQPVRTEE